MSFKLIPSVIPDCYEIEFMKLNDNRGSFIKTYHSELYKELQIDIPLREEYFTYSHKNVFRGLHFQTPPKAIDKLVYCVSGHVKDYVVDIRKNSSTYGHYVCFDLKGEKPSAVFVPKGFAHGFYVLSDNALMQYKVSDVFNKECDAGISYKTFDFAKDIVNPVLSERDTQFVTLSEFSSPF